MAWIQPMIDRLGEDVTLRTVAYGARDSVTGHPAISFTESTIKASIVRTSSREVRTSAGDAVAVDIRVISYSTMKIHDEIIHHGETYRIVTEPVSHWVQWYYDVNARLVT